MIGVSNGQGQATVGVQVIDGGADQQANRLLAAVDATGQSAYWFAVVVTSGGPVSAWVVSGCN